jgi:DHA3 family multidrug efflux protein-like MFS transporter
VDATEHATKAAGPALQLRVGTQRIFLHLLLDTLAVSVVHYTVWFAITFWIYLETGSVFATALIAGIYLVATASTGIWFGSLVDHHRKKTVMQASSVVGIALYAACLAMYVVTPDDVFEDPASARLWVFAVVLMCAVILGNLRTITMPTLVTLLIPADVRDKANGLVGTTTGVSFLVTSVISGLLVAAGGMLYALMLAVGALILSMVHLGAVDVHEDRPGSVGADGAADTPSQDAARKADRSIDLRGTLLLVAAVPGLPALIVFSCFNNFLGGVFMALMDAYGLSMVSVQAWGLLWGALSTGVIVGGLVVSRVGLSSNPVRIMLLVNLVLWGVTCLFPLRSSVIVLTLGLYVFMLLMPFAEAAEATILQRVVPYERQGRVFGFAQSVEQAASPLTAFMIGPIAQFVFIPLMTDGAGADAIGGWFGTGPDRGIALVFVLTGIVGLAATALALASPFYRKLSHAYGAAQPQSVASLDDAEPAVPVGDNAQPAVPVGPVTPEGS